MPVLWQPIHRLILGLPVNTFYRWAPVAAAVVFIFILSSIPGDKYPRVDIPNADKGMHALLYLPLGWFLARAFAARTRNAAAECRQALIAIAIGIAYGASDEVHQIWTPHRDCDLYDWLVDCAAVIIAVILWQLYARFILRHHVANDVTKDHPVAETSQS